MLQHVALTVNDSEEIENFINAKKEKKVFSHVCLAYRKAEITFNNAIQCSYKALIKKGEGHNTYFKWDKSGNMFEMKEIT